MAREIHLKGE